MTQRDYILIAKSLYRIVPNNDEQETGFLMAVNALCETLKNDNSRFDERKFLDACGIERKDNGLLSMVPF